MTTPLKIQPDPQLDLVLERRIDVPPELVWAAWTEPEHLCRWFTPAPWTVSECQIDLRPGGMFRTVMCSPEGDEMPSAGCYLEVVLIERLTFTSALQPGYRPAPSQSMPFTAIVDIRPEGEGTHYKATALHADETSRKKHEDMGFHQGWGAALDQLVAHMKEVQKGR
ncbi:MAG: SRPBCC family protein [Pirellulaceae bacterium]